LAPIKDCPNGVLAHVLESEESEETARRVELFARAREKVFGILRTFFVAYSEEKELLEIAESSNSVIQVRTVGEVSMGCPQDFLILKRLYTEEINNRQRHSYRTTLPDVLVPTRWTERMKLKTGDTIVVCRAPAEYSIAPPIIQPDNLI
jgi:hypothetical protein